MSYYFQINGAIEAESYYDDAFSLQDLNFHLQQANGEDLYIDINSIGGDLHTGVSIFTNLLRYAETNNAHITTRANGFVASIATVIFLAGNKRIVNEYMQPFIHEPLFFGGTGSQTTKEIQEDVVALQKARDLMADLYSEFVGIDKSKALELMANNTWLTANECLELGFATEIEKLKRSDMRIVASLKSKLINKYAKMSKKQSTWQRLAALLKTTSAQLELADVSGNPVIFPELEEGDTPKEGDKITVDGDAAFSGEVETEQYHIVAIEGVVESVIDKTEVNEEEIIEELLDIIDEQAKELEDVEAKLAKMQKLHKAIGKKVERPERRGKGEDGEPSNKALDAINKFKNKK